MDAALATIDAKRELAAIEAEIARRLELERYDWDRNARPAQLPPPGAWFAWLVMAGRGFGKTRTGAEWVRAKVKAGARRIALVTTTPRDARDVMIEGESGLLAVCPPDDRPKYEPSKRRLTWPNGAIATTFSDEAPRDLRGPQHDAAWADELCKFRNPRETWDMLMFGLRLGAHPQVCVTTTPSPIPVLKELLQDPDTVRTEGSTFDNIANLSPKFIEQVVKRYEGTRLGQQELYAQMIEEAEGALWKRDQLEALRVRSIPALRRIVVAIDPAATSGQESDETGIVVAGVADDGQGYVLDDISGHYTPHEWALRAINAFRVQGADLIIGEANQGGEMVEHTLRTVDPNISYRAVHASRGKRTRAEPIAALYEQGKVHHQGYLGELEDQMCTWSAGDGEASPDRVDALVWALTDLMVDQSSGAGWIEYMKAQARKAQGTPTPKES